VWLGVSLLVRGHFVLKKGIAMKDYSPLQWAGLALGVYVVWHILQYAWFAIFMLIVCAIAFIVCDLIDR
jgi:hypothetical protein